MVGVGYYSERVMEATTELAAIKNGVFTVALSIYLAAVVVVRKSLAEALEIED